ncbi:MAG: prepilin-type N-terminal cleavage/methylation domain-containing protein [Magnetococcales bacterium]|nr:prepilin-type N-terminal cleavage/methylation domain-containing protein [Magnetococcales bacterium]
MYGSPPKQAGFTLIELMISMLLSLILLSGIVEIFGSSRDNYRIQDAITNRNRDARASLEFMSREFRNIALISDATDTPDNITFYADNDSVDVGMVTEATTNTMTDSNKSWAFDEWAETTVIITSGTGKGEVNTVTSNSEEQLILASNWGVTPDETSVYHIDVESRAFNYDSGTNTLKYTKGETVDQVFAENIESLTFVTDAAPPDTGKITIQLTVRTTTADPGDGLFKDLTLKSQVMLRN